MMQRIADIAAQALSILLYPLFVPTYGVALFCYAFHTQVVPLPAVWVLIAVLGTLLLTCILYDLYVHRDRNSADHSDLDLNPTR